MFAEICVLLAALAPQKNGAETVPIPGTTAKFDLVPLPAGKYKVGDPAREVELRGVLLGAREVSWGEFRLYYDSRKQFSKDGITRPSKGDAFFPQVGIPKEFGEANRAATNLRWHAAQGYCDWLSAATGGYYRVPTEAEWEAACRAGSAAADDDHAWHAGNSKGKSPVLGTKRPNSLGVHDLLGGVWEICLEFSRPEEFSPVYKGGAWNSPAEELRPSRRQLLKDAWIKTDVNSPPSVWWLGTTEACQGFRVARVLDAAGRKAASEYFGKVEVKFGEWKAGTEQVFRDLYTTVRGTVTNTGDRTIDELEVMVCPLNKGKPVLMGVNSQGSDERALHGKCYPVLVNGYADGPQRQPLKPKESRPFVALLPFSWGEGEWEEGKFQLKVTNLRLAEE